MQAKEKGIMPKSQLFFLTPSKKAQSLFFYILCMGHFWYEDQYHLVREDYHSYLLMYVKVGAAKIKQNHREYVVNAGELVLLNCHEPHEYWPLGELETKWLHFDGSNVSMLYEELREQYDGQIILRHGEQAVRILEQLFEDCSKEQMLSEASQSLEIMRILTCYLDGDKECCEDTGVITLAQQYMKEHFNGVVTLRMIAKEVSLSEFYFARKFKKETGYTVHEYLIHLRINEAKRMLKNTAYTQKEIAYECGFSNEASFCNTFKKYTAMTPKTFRYTSL